MLKNLNFQIDGRKVIYSSKRSSQKSRIGIYNFLFGIMALNPKKQAKKAENDHF